MNVLMSDADYAPWLMDALKLIEEEKVKKTCSSRHYCQR